MTSIISYSGILPLKPEQTMKYDDNLYQNMLIIKHFVHRLSDVFCKVVH